MDPILTQDKYLQCLDQLLLELRSRFIGGSHALLGHGADVDGLDDYLLELNTYYYSSFANRYVPQLREMMISDIRDLNNIHLQDESLRKLIIACIRQEARLYNEIRKVSAQLKNKYQELSALQIAGQNDLEAKGVQLIFIWKDLERFLTAFLSELRKLQNFFDDQPLQAALNKYPGLSSVGVLLDRLDTKDQRSGRELSRLLANWQLGTKLTAKYSSDSRPARDVSRTLGVELEKIDLSWDNRKLPIVLRSWYKKNIQPTFRLYRDTLRLAGEKNEHRLFIQVADELQDWLGSLLLVIEKGLYYKQQECHHLIYYGLLAENTDADRLRDQIVFGARALQAVEESISGLVASPHASYSNYSESCHRLLKEISHFIMKQQEQLGPCRLDIIFPPLLLLKNQLEGLEVRLEQAEEQKEQTCHLLQHNGEIAAGLDRCLQFLGDIQEDLGRRLNNRYLSHLFAGIDLRLEHLVISSGAMFPASHRHLVDNGLIKVQPSPGPEGRVLSSGGDIFIVNLDGQQEMEIPEIIIAVKG